MIMSILSLPGELLVEIFSTVIEDLGDAPAEPVVLILASLCKSLRELLLASPTVWRRIRVRTFADLRGAHLFIERSKACPLELSVHFDIFDHIPHEFIQALDLPRLCKLSVSGPFSNDIARFVQAISDTPTPLLRDVSLLARTQSNCGNAHVPLLSGASDALRTLTMRGCVRCLAPFPHLTRLNISNLLCNYADFRDLINGSPSLTTLILGNLLDHLDPDSDNEAAVAGPMFEASALKYLAVGFLNTYLVSGDRPLLGFLSMPNLEYLEVVGSRADYGEFSGKSFPALRTLCLRDLDFPTCDVALYRSFSNITRLELSNVQGMELLTVPEEKGAPLWPDLQDLVCWLPDEESCSWLDGLLASRARLTLHVPLKRKNNFPPAGGRYDIRFLSDQPSGLIGPEDFASMEWEDDDSSNSEDFFSDEIDLFENDESFDYEPEPDEDFDEEEAYYEDEDDDWDGVWFGDGI
ncbi:hypothetical protein B0H15DRAFT_223235 [Mycena belliarum]|uniref:F-box domain-containing protein n=1 Tax=Mycena belliarum TaxID=1033014 RepID=A0AAD6UM93_9AGAR|nr:hypothetical protein B0H15DRAFT_223235 [Mycena belliae]